MYKACYEVHINNLNEKELRNESGGVLRYIRCFLLREVCEML